MIMTHKILIIDDNHELRDMLKDLLSMKGYTVITAATGEDGIHKAESDTPDLIICDVSMPEKDGFAVLKEVRENPSTEKVPFVFLTASMIRSDEETLLKSNANGFLTKPYNSKKLFDMVDGLLKPE